MMLTESVDNTFSIIVSDDDAPFSPQDTVPNPRGGTIEALPTRMAPELGGLFLKSFLGESLVKDLKGLKTIARIVATTKDGNLIACGNLEGKLDLQGLDRLQVQMSIRGRNVGHPRATYST